MKRLMLKFRDRETLLRALAAVPAAGFSVPTEEALGWNDEVVLVLVHPTTGAEIELRAIVQGGTAMEGVAPSITVLPTEPDAALRLAEFGSG